MSNVKAKEMIDAIDINAWLEAQGFKRVHRNTIRSWMDVGARGRVLPYRTVGGKRYVRETDLIEFTN